MVAQMLMFITSNQLSQNLVLDFPLICVPYPIWNIFEYYKTTL